MSITPTLGRSYTFDDMHTETTYDDEIRDMISQELYKRDWHIRGSLDVCRRRAGHEDCIGAGRCHDQFFNFIYLDQSTHLAEAMTLLPSGESESVEVMPPNPSLFEQYWTYFRDSVFDGTKGEVLMSVCRRGTKSPSFDIKGCLVGRTSERVPNGFATLRQKYCSWVLFVPTSTMMNLFDSLNEISIRPVPGIHDAMAYNSARISVSKHITECELDESEWTRGRELHAVSRLVPCEAVTTATFTVSVVLTPYLLAKGTHTARRHLRIVVHNIR